MKDGFWVTRTTWKHIVCSNCCFEYKKDGIYPKTCPNCNTSMIGIKKLIKVR